MTNIDEQLQRKIFEDEIYQFQRVFQPAPQDIPMIDLYENWQSGKVDHEPEYQRKFVWSLPKQSYFIESLILGIDTPIIYFVEVEREVGGYPKIIREAIDGRQRLSTIFNFCENKLVLKDLNEHSPLYNDLNGKTYKELNEKYQRVFKQYTIRSITFKLVDRNIDVDTQLKFKYQLFHRYNSGLTALNQQEVRNCQYSQNAFHKLFKKISKSDLFIRICPFFKGDQRMADDEYVTLLYMLTLFDDALDVYAKKNKNPFINAYFDRIDANIYNLDDIDAIEVDEEDEEGEEDIEVDKKTISHQFMAKVEASIMNNLEKVHLIYGSFLKGIRQERYLIETLYYHFAKDNRLTKSFLKNNAYELGKFINDRLKEIENTPSDPESFNLIDCYKEKVFNTSRIRYRFNEMQKIIEEYYATLN